MSRASSPSSKRSPKKPADRTSIADAAPRDTVQVRDSWIEADKKGPPPLQGAAADRDTLQVRQSWIDADDRPSDATTSSAPPRTSTESVEPVSTAEKIAKAKSKAGSKRAKPKKQSRNMRPSLDPSWEVPGPESEPGRRALPPPLPGPTAPVATTQDAAPPSRRKKTR